MMFGRDEYSIECGDGTDLAVLKGVMRFPTPAAFDQAFAPLARRIERGEPLRVDLCGVSFMNSSGIRALATLILSAKQRGTRLSIVGSNAIPWQKKTLASLHLINPDVHLETR